MIKWKNEKRKLGELKPFPGNPRKANEKEWDQLKKSLDRFNLADPLIINTDNTVIGGNFRLKILKEKYGNNQVVDVRVPERALNRKEAEELNLRLNKNQGSWDEELLVNFDEDLLKKANWDIKEINIDNVSTVIVKDYKPMNKKVKIKIAEGQIIEGELVE